MHPFGLACQSAASYQQYWSKERKEHDASSALEVCTYSSEASFAAVALLHVSLSVGPWPAAVLGSCKMFGVFGTPLPSVGPSL